ncbi:predicted protein [Chaetomium globosum CBS 148.51]|uniref:Uncharacterized protein n=1 Tax=Chaetomium globosum (strain ATCC 6205 / CBS 148.51 / DSM 1962 / NBRC 6347 / NRRL 1970) TaxID=306901 RepID=Q2HDV3_CHAGB|nr:uncharacterized protein CHGG_01601 [Chaetomium globosum CBS 148.51]EAQ93366.1 predicted protein [Chaetomium globosum CBS 148.51]
MDECDTHPRKLRRSGNPLHGLQLTQPRCFPARRPALLLRASNASGSTSRSRPRSPPHCSVASPRGGELRGASEAAKRPHDLRVDQLRSTSVRTITSLLLSWCWKGPCWPGADDAEERRELQAANQNRPEIVPRLAVSCCALPPFRAASRAASCIRKPNHS